MASPGNPAPKPPAPRNMSKFIGSLSVGMGIITVATGFIPCLGWTALATGGIGIILSLYGLFYSARRGTSTTLCILGLVLCIIGILGFIIPNWILAKKNYGNT
jgi:uncharacterized membrane protein YbaN (DUF454 family)